MKQELIQKSKNISDYLLKSDVIDIDYSDKELWANLPQALAYK